VLRAGTLNRHVRIEAFGTATNEIGEPVKAWALHDRAWVGIKTVSGKQYVTADRETHTAAVSIRARYRTDVTASMRIVVGAVEVDGAVDYSKATVYGILAVLPDEERREHVDFACSTGARA
jgi:SPP1 family predicted phage head-tail adaptor